MRTLFLAASALTLCALAACGQDESPSDDSSISAETPPPPAVGPAAPARPVTQAAAVGDGEGAYGMPRAPIPYDKLGAYEQQQDQPGGQDPSLAAQTDQPPGPPGQPPSKARMSSKPRAADTVFY